MRLLRFFAILLLFTSCGAFVVYDYEKSTDFSKYKTYNYYSDIKSGFNQLDENSLLRALDDKLQSMGLEKSETPSFNIDVQSAEVTLNSNSSVGVGVPKEWAYYRLAQIYKHKKDNQKALTYIDKALEIRSDFKQALKEKSLILSK